MYTPVYFNHGSDDTASFVQVDAPAGSIPKADVITIAPNETIGSMAQRAYGANTAAYRARIEHANESLDGATIGEIRAPR